MAELTDPSIKTVTTLADGDLIHNVDVSDTTANPAGTSAKISLGNLKATLGAASNLRIVNSESDLPAAVGSVITFGAAENGFTYRINETLVTDKEFVIEDGITIKFTSVNLDKAWVYVGTNTMFTSADFNIIEIDSTIFTAPTAAKMFDLSGAGTLIKSRSFFSGGNSYGNLDNSFTTMQFVDFSDFGQGCTASGSFAFSISNGSAQDWRNESGTMFSISGINGMQTVSLVNIGFTPNATETVFNLEESLEAAGTSINMATVIFDQSLGGDVLAPNSLNQKYIKSKFSGNSGIADSTVKAKIRYVGNTLATTIAGIGTNTPILTDANYEISSMERFIAQDAVTFDFTINTLTTAFIHGESLNDKVFLHTYTGVLPSGLDATTKYFVINPTATTFQLSLTSGGAAINFTDNGSGALFYRHDTGFSNSSELIYIGLEDTSVAPDGWIGLEVVTNNFDDMRGVIMKIDLAGNVTENQIGSTLTTNNTRPLSSNLSDILDLTTGEGVALHIRNDSAIRNIRATESLLNIKKS